MNFSVQTSRQSFPAFENQFCLPIPFCRLKHFNILNNTITLSLCSQFFQPTHVRRTTTFDAQFWGKKVRLVHGWTRYVCAGVCVCTHTSLRLQVCACPYSCCLMRLTKSSDQNSKSAQSVSQYCPSRNSVFTMHQRAVSFQIYTRSIVLCTVLPVRCRALCPSPLCSGTGCVPPAEPLSLYPQSCH